MKNMVVYILRCSDDSFYVGVTNDIGRRLAEHQEGIDVTCYTFSRRPVQLVYTQLFHEPERAIRFEKQLKGWSRKKKQALISGDIERLKQLSNAKKYIHPSESDGE